MNKIRRNILFFFNTRIRKDLIVEKDYINKIDRDNEIKFSGKYHYIIAGAKAIYDHLADNNPALDHIICVSDIGDDNKEFLTAGLHDIMKDTPPVTWISHDRYDRSDIILKKISSEFEFQENDRLFILTNGGARNNVMFFSTFTQIMKAKGLDTRLIYITQETPEVIKDVSSDNRYFNVLRAVELFTQSGNPKQLKEIYGNDPSLSELLRLMDQFYKNIQICKTVNDASTGIVSVFTKMIEEIDSLMGKDIDIIIRLLLPTIRSKFLPLGTDNNEYFLQILQWCCNNDMILVGFFILDAELKAYLYDKKVISFKGFDMDGNTIYLPSMNSIEKATTNARDRSNYETSLGEIGGKHKTRGYTEALALVFRIIVNSTSYIDFNRLDPVRSSDRYFEAFIEFLKKIEIELYDKPEKNLKLFELILLQDFIRNLRNNMAHAESTYTIKGKKNIIGLVKKSYKYKGKEKELFNCKFGNNPDIQFDDPDIYNKLKFIIEKSVKIISDDINSL